MLNLIISTKKTSLFRANLSYSMSKICLANVAIDFIIN